jgi:hypothetical protein
MCLTAFVLLIAAAADTTAMAQHATVLPVA